MARSRNIKPGFFQNDFLAEVEPLGRLLFAGLWCVADRSGRLEDRPKRIKAAVLPYDDCDVDVLLNELAARGFIVRYQMNSRRYIQVLNFNKHQAPHCKEPESTIPAPDKYGTNLVQEQSLNDKGTGAAPPDSLNLIPDTGLPIFGQQVAKQSKGLDESIGKKDSSPPRAPKRGSALAANFYPDETGILLADELQVNVANELLKFSDHHNAKGNVMKDWQAAWRGWVRNSVQFATGGKQVKQNYPTTYTAQCDAERARVSAVLTGRPTSAALVERDITAEVSRVE